MLQPLLLSTLNNLGLADGQAIRITRALCQHRKILVKHSHAGAASQPPFFHHHAAFFIDFGRIERKVVGPIFQNQHRPIHRFRLISRHCEHIYRFVKARISVYVRSKAHAQRLNECNQVVLGKVAGAVESHVLDKMRQPLLVIVFENRSGLDDQAQFSSLLRFLISADVIPHPVREFARRDLGVDRHRLVCRLSLSHDLLPRYGYVRGQDET